MKSKKQICGLEFDRFGFKNAWVWISGDTLQTSQFVFFVSYDTPIMCVQHVGNTCAITLNDNAYKYSSTTSKQITQFITEMHFFTTWCADMPWSLRDGCCDPGSCTVIKCNVEDLKDMMYVM